MPARTGLVGSVTLFRFSVRKLLLHRRWLLVAVLAFMVCAVMGYAAAQAAADIGTASDMMDDLMLTFLLPVMALIYGASMIRNEIDDRSIIQVVTSPLDRRLSYLGYYLALATVLALMVAVVTALGSASYFMINGAEGAIPMTMGFLTVMVIGSFAYSSLFLLLGVVLRQPIYLGLFYVFIWEGFIGSLPGAISDYTIRHQLRVIASDLIDEGSIAYLQGDPGTAALMLASLTILLLALGAFALREKEIS